ncbi:hypothetical protein KCP75_14500 [Salmonella enterica subsp. enterica]|nr:hypothetical protein KCP75_14500 [Salmonella enterica subsp. enterica]
MTGNIWSRFYPSAGRRVMCQRRRQAKNVNMTRLAPGVDVDQQGRPVMRYIDQFGPAKDSLKKASG